MPSADFPAVLYLGDFKGDGSQQLVEAYSEGGRLYPWRSRRDLGAAIPSVLRNYPRNDAYAAATLGDILGEERLAAARRFAATQFQSGVFLGRPDGTYASSPCHGSRRWRRSRAWPRATSTATGRPTSTPFRTPIRRSRRSGALMGA